MRVATPDDRDLVVAWTEGFMRDAFGEADPAEVVSTADRWISGSERTLYLWMDGEATSLAGVGGPTPNGIRIGPVYTPPEARRRGYASALVAAVSQAELDAGRRFCFLFTDLANPTSNHIYQDIGYEPVRDVDAYTFDGALSRSALRVQLAARGEAILGKPLERPLVAGAGADQRHDPVHTRLPVAPEQIDPCRPLGC